MAGSALWFNSLKHHFMSLHYLITQKDFFLFCLKKAINIVSFSKANSFIVSCKNSIYGSTLVQSKIWEKLNFTKMLVLSTIVLFHSLISLTAIN